MKTLLFKLSLFIPFAFLVVFTNYFGDPSNVFSDIEFDMARLLLNRHNISVQNFNDRLLQKHYIFNRSHPPEVVVIGSSRTMVADSSLFPGRTFFNHSMGTATLEDFMAITELYVLKGQMPETIVLGVDPWLFKAFNGYTRWKALSEYYALYQNAAESSERLDRLKYTWNHVCSKIDFYTMMVSLNYFQASYKHYLNMLYLGETGRTRLYDTELNSSRRCNIQKWDGCVVWDHGTNHRNPQESTYYAEYIVDQQIAEFRDGFNIANKSLTEFERLVDFLADKDAHVIFWLPPYHPRLYDKIAQNPRWKPIQDIQAKITDMAHRKGIPVYGSFNPGDMNLSPDDFFDGHHMKNERGLFVMKQQFSSRANEPRQSH